MQITEANLCRAATICVGSSVYNAVTDYYLGTCNPPVEFVKIGGNDSSDKRITIKINRKVGNVSPQTLSVDPGHDLAMLVKLYSNNENTCNDEDNVVFIAAGIGVNGTKAAVYYLLKKWRILSRDFKEKSFAIILDCIDHETRNDGYKEFDVKYRIPN